MLAKPGFLNVYFSLLGIVEAGVNCPYRTPPLTPIFILALSGLYSFFVVFVKKESLKIKRGCPKVPFS